MRIFVKVCGLTDEAAVDAAVASDADAVGFVLEPSPRQVSFERAVELAARVPERVTRVLVFREIDRVLLDACLSRERFDWVQADAGSAIPRGRGVRFVPSIADAPDVVERVLRAPRVFVFDGADGPGRGRRVDPGRAEILARRGAMLLAGGLDPTNVTDAISRVRPFGVDVSSGVESRPGVKDPRRIAEFVAAVRACERSLGVGASVSRREVAP